MMPVLLLTEDLRLLEDLISVLTHTLWFVVGAAAVIVLGTSWQRVHSCVAALNLLHIVPIGAALAGTTLRGRKRFLAGLQAVIGRARGSVVDTILSVIVCASWAPRSCTAPQGNHPTIRLRGSTCPS